MISRFNQMASVGSKLKARLGGRGLGVWVSLASVLALAGAWPAVSAAQLSPATSDGTVSEQKRDAGRTGQTLETSASWPLIFSDDSARIVVFSMAAILLVVIMLGGAFVILNFGLMSRRREDRIGGRSPSDVALLGQMLWPEESAGPSVLPAMEEDDEAAGVGPGAELGQPAPPGKDRGDALEDASITSLGYSLRELRRGGHSTSVAHDLSGVGREERESA